MIESLKKKNQLIKKNYNTFDNSLKLIDKYDKFYSKLSDDELKSLKGYKYIDYYIINQYFYDQNKFFKSLDIDLGDFIIFLKDKKNNKLNNNKKNSNKNFMIDIKNINKYLKEYIYNFSDKFLNQIIQIDNIFKKSPKITKDIVVYRGIYINEEKNTHMYNKLLSIKKNEVITIPNYYSTSLLDNIAKDFLGNSGKRIECCIFKINILKGAKILYLDSLLLNIQSSYSKELRKKSNNFHSEYEILIPRGAKIKFIKKYNILKPIPHLIKSNYLKKFEKKYIAVYEFSYKEIDENTEYLINNKNNRKKFLENYKNIKIDILPFSII